MTKPIVSVLMITYNHAPYIIQAIEGVLQQKVNFPIELVIGEDCSTDGTRNTVFKYQKKYPNIIRVITYDKNVGARKNAYLAGKACWGKYIALCEGDDHWHHSYKLQKQVDYLESHQECGLVFSSYDVYHVKSKKRIKDFIRYNKWEIPESPNISDYVDGKVGNGLGIMTCTVVVRRTLREQIKESDPYLHQSNQFKMGDTQLWAEIIDVSHVKYIPESLATHNIFEGSMTRSKDIKKNLQFSISANELMLYLCNKYNLQSSIRQKHEASWCDNSLRLAFYSRDVELANEVRGQKKTFTWKEWLRYYGAKKLAFYYAYRIAILLLNLFRNKHDKWL